MEIRDPGLVEAIEAVGGVTELARRIGISQPSVTNWERVPAERVIAVEQATGVGRVRLRPDLYSDTTTSETDDFDVARAREYSLLSTLLARAPDAALLSRLARLDGDESPLGMAHRALRAAARESDPHAVEREYFDLFIGVGRSELLPYGSYYLTGFLYERPLARLRSDLEQLGIERAEGNREPEDHAATLCEIMAALVSREVSAPDGAGQNLFERHIAPWMPRFFADLENAKSARFYRGIGTLGRVFMDIESQAFALPA